MKASFVLTLFWLSLLTYVAKTAKILHFATDLQDFAAAFKLFTVALQSSFFACCWVFVLTDNGMILSWFRGLCFSAVDWYSWDGKGVNQKKRATAEYLLKPVLTCERCTTGNACVWCYLLSYGGKFSILDFLFVLSLSIFITILTAKIWQRN